jgi:hypothetical protein
VAGGIGFGIDVGTGGATASTGTGLAVSIAQPTPPSPVGLNLDIIKQDAIAELRPLVDKLNLSPEDRFNTILLIIRSTDDASLLPAVHAAAKQIPDDGRRAQALLDVIKEIDFFKQ